MKTYKQFVNEEVMPFAQTDKNFIGVDSEAVRDNINDLFDGVTNKGFVTPYSALQRIAKVLAYAHIHLPKYTFSEGDHGATAFQVHQFGEKAGMTNDGEFVKKVPAQYYVYFEYHKNDNGLYDVFASICDKDELDDLISDYEDESDNNFDDRFVDDLDQTEHDYERNMRDRAGHLQEARGPRTDPPAHQIIPEVAAKIAKKVSKKAKDQRHMDYTHPSTITKKTHDMSEASDDEWNKALAAKDKVAQSATGKIFAPSKDTIERQIGTINEPAKKDDYNGDINMLKKDTARWANIDKQVSKPMDATPKPVTQQDRQTASQFEEYVSENYHDTYSGAIKKAIEAAKKRGYEVDADDYHSKVSSGPRKPSEGKTVSHNLKLTKNGKPTKKGLSIQVYNKGGKTPYELNHYISEEKSGMPAWYEKEKRKSVSLQAMTAEKKKQQGKKIKQAIRLAKEETQLNELSNKTKIAYVNAATKDKAELNKQIAKDTHSNSKYHDSESGRLKDIAFGHKLVALRTKGIERAKSTMKEEPDPSKIQILDKKGFINALKKGKQKQQAAKTPEKANFNVAKKLARQAAKEFANKKKD